MILILLTDLMNVEGKRFLSTSSTSNTEFFFSHWVKELFVAFPTWHCYFGRLWNFRDVDSRGAFVWSSYGPLSGSWFTWILSSRFTFLHLSSGVPIFLPTSVSLDQPWLSPLITSSPLTVFLSGICPWWCEPILMH